MLPKMVPLESKPIKKVQSAVVKRLAEVAKPAAATASSPIRAAPNHKRHDIRTSRQPCAHSSPPSRHLGEDAGLGAAAALFDKRLLGGRVGARKALVRQTLPANVWPDFTLGCLTVGKLRPCVETAKLRRYRLRAAERATDATCSATLSQDPRAYPVR
ncbi:MAG: hypothetical protein FJX25_10600 [Alphaproteobacteria bacterium]|nr:hypothetical protein [Alphaproteobacteria bacterium]